MVAAIEFLNAKLRARQSTYIHLSKNFIAFGFLHTGIPQLPADAANKIVKQIYYTLHKPRQRVIKFNSWPPKLDDQHFHTSARLRAALWSRNIPQTREFNEQLYSSISTKATPQNRLAIAKDVPRTFARAGSWFSPKSMYVNTKWNTEWLNEEQAARSRLMLERILMKYSNVFEYGYTQGMNNVVASMMAMLEFDEQLTFKFFDALMRHPKYGFNQLYADKFPLLLELVQVYEKLLGKQLPQAKQLLDQANYHPLIYASDMIIGLFQREDRFSPMLRGDIMDLIFVHGKEAIPKILLSIIKILEPQLLKAKNMEELQRIILVASFGNLMERNFDGNSKGLASIKLHKMPFTFPSFGSEEEHSNCRC